MLFNCVHVSFRILHELQVPLYSVIISTNLQLAVLKELSLVSLEINYRSTPSQKS